MSGPHRIIYLATFLLSLFCIVQPVVGDEPKRGISLEGQSNFRDIGGYKTRDGKQVKWREIFRSGELPKLTDEDVQLIADLNIKSVVNFLTKEEIADNGKDRLPKGVVQISLPISGDNLAAVISEARRNADFTKIPEELNPEIHQIIIHDAKKEYAELFRKVIDPANRPLVFHCSHGVHRTGTAAALLLSTLGVPWETVREDYLLSNEFRKEEVELRLNQLQQKAAKSQEIKPEEVDMTNLNAFYVLEGKYIDASLAEIKKEYGSIDNYLKQGLGLKQQELDKLRAELLE